MTPQPSSQPSLLLRNGKVLITGGFGGSFPVATQTLRSAELYDPATGLMSVTGSMAYARYRHTATLLTDGRVLVAGGYDWWQVDPLTSAEVYDPATETVFRTGWRPRRLAVEWFTANPDSIP